MFISTTIVESLHLSLEVLAPVLLAPGSTLHTDDVSKPGSATFKPPEKFAVYFFGEVIVEEFSWSQSFDVPQMKVLV
jgi:hypothetical protein